ncbi:MAG: helix-turn-helix domain-containing protein [Cystobacterineae bacterium]|nr:helix-turn-helix domain-containing protein [Cystobacterineae bacterium]
MNITLPGYHIVFVESPPLKPKKETSFSWVLRLSAEAFPSKDSLRSQAFAPLSQPLQSEATEASLQGQNEAMKPPPLTDVSHFNPPFRLSPKPKPRCQRMAPEFVSQAHEYSGSLLGEVRCFHGITLGELADATRVAQHHLQNIECEQYDRLPATVYLRGYLKSVARELGLDVQLVSQSYLERMQQAKT